MLAATSLPAPRTPETRAAEVVTVGADGSYWGGMAVDWAAQHAWLRGASLRVVRAQDDVPSDVPADLGLSHAHRLYPLLPITCHVAGDTPVVDLTAASADSALLVLGCRGHRRFGLGELVVPTLAAARCDVVVVRGTPMSVRGEYHIVTAMISGGDADTAVLRRAAEFAASHRARLRVVHAAPDELWPSRQPEDVLHIAELQLKALGAPTRVTFTLARRLPHEALEDPGHTDLLVVARGHSARHALGPVTRAALYHSPSPVLVVRR
ncbi:universal stress protein [Kutzneria buriramensis]|uniref:Nucleotide-binding universal stress UspA family protein n=1 Tax=Kutzneria buriramensis TaxID=1045776 RepID=A0A3E0GZK4_9PSEU|nr:universal stress protein [Kutzneria buriramensis]REH34784.1 nucleotide-binding universal stress UspA family protein [Kutzneria buriramensis]